MRFEALRERVLRVNQGLVPAGLVVLSFGNASAVDRDEGVVAIKPSGVGYDTLQPEDIVVLALEDGRVVDGDRRASSDSPTHLFLYRRWPGVGGIVHTHSTAATGWAQARRELPCLGTTHADHFRGPVPVTRLLTPGEIGSDYEANTGRVILERFEADGLDPLHVPAVLDASHGPFSWGRTLEEALENAVALEVVARMALHAVALDPGIGPIQPELLARHFLRKHGSGAYYGQPEDGRDRALD
jgi:L-ribulose-5-phosphate 4-epimerase